MLHTCTITGTLWQNGGPVRGLIRFTPDRLWVIEKGIAYACLAPEILLDEDGSFVARVTATDSDAICWKYRIQVERWDFHIEVPWNQNGYSLRELLHERHPGKGSPHRR